MYSGGLIAQSLFHLKLEIPSGAKLLLAQVTEAENVTNADR